MVKTPSSAPYGADAPVSSREAIRPSFREQKAAKKLYEFGPRRFHQRGLKFTKVFCFFFSKKKCLLASSRRRRPGKVPEIGAG
jgi:hypothetical protein